jgi:hypothetical protein
MGEMKKLFIVIFLSLMGLSFFGVTEQQTHDNGRFLQVTGKGMEPTLTEGKIVRFSQDPEIRRFDIVSTSSWLSEEVSGE